jgi:hypothetical protein
MLVNVHLDDNLIQSIETDREFKLRERDNIKGKDSILVKISSNYTRAEGFSKDLYYKDCKGYIKEYTKGDLIK